MQQQNRVQEKSPSHLLMHPHGWGTSRLPLHYSLLSSILERRCQSNAAKMSWEYTMLFVCAREGPHGQNKGSKYISCTSTTFFFFVKLISPFVSGFDLFFVFSICSAVFINYLFTYATWGHLADSAKPGGKLLNTIAEVGIYAMNGKKTRGATKRIMPLHISVSPYPPLIHACPFFFISFCIASIF